MITDRPCPKCEKLLKYRTTSHGWYCDKCDFFQVYEHVKQIESVNEILPYWDGEKFNPKLI